VSKPARSSSQSIGALERLPNLKSYGAPRRGPTSLAKPCLPPANLGVGQAGGAWGLGLVGRATLRRFTKGDAGRKYLPPSILRCRPASDKQKRSHLGQGMYIHVPPSSSRVPDSGELALPSRKGPSRGQTWREALEHVEQRATIYPVSRSSVESRSMPTSSHPAAPRRGIVLHLLYNRGRATTKAYT